MDIREASWPIFEDPSSRFDTEETFATGHRVVQRLLWAVAKVTAA